MIRRWLLLCVLALASGGAAWADALPLNQQPMFGGQEKNAAMKRVNQAGVMFPVAVA